jgi:tetratricopeptide (TPR) repeat protein
MRESRNSPIGRRRLVSSIARTLSGLLFSGLVAAATSACLAHEPPVAAWGDTPTDQAVRLANQGNVDRAIQVLRDHLDKNEKDIQARVVLGRILDFDGRPDEAVAVWEKGLSGGGADFPLLMSIGEIRHRQGQGGPTIIRRRGMIGASPSKDEAGEERFKRAHLALAATAFEKARKLRPDQPEPAGALASVYEDQGKYDSAAEVWKSVVTLEPRSAGSHLRLGLATQKAGRPDEAVQHFTKAIEIDPRLARAHEALAEYQKGKGLAAEAELSRKRAEFYKRLPPFCTFPYSEENQKTLDSLDEEGTVRKLADDPSERAAEFLAVVCWSHPHNWLETQAFEVLESRGDKTTPLLRALLAEARSTCTVKSTAHILARRKAEGLFENLERKLPGDVRGFAMDMDIAGSLDELGDPRAVEPLAQVLAPPDGGAPEDDLSSDRNSARARAALALGAFDTPEARRALEAAIGDPQVKSYCLAALYRLTRDPKRLAALEKSAGPDESYKTYVLGNYLLKKVGTDQAKALSRRWEEQREARRAREKKGSGAD